MADPEPEDNPTLAPPEDTDLADEIQDWRLLSSLASSKSDPTSLPRRGEKNFEPDGTNRQERVLNESREAMRTALEVERKFTGKTSCQCTWLEELGLARVDKLRGPHFKNLGVAAPPNTTTTADSPAEKTSLGYLLPEETIYMLERGSLEVFYPSGIPMSLQGIYAACNGSSRTRVEAEVYAVYASLKRSGESGRKSLWSPWVRGMFSSIFAAVFKPSRPAVRTPDDAIIPTDRKFRHYEDVYKFLSLVPYHSFSSQPSLTLTLQSVTNGTAHPSPWQVHFDIWKPATKFKRSEPPAPDFRICVVNSCTTDTPSLTDINTLLSTIPFPSPPQGGGQAGVGAQMKKLKEGRRSVLLAVVDSGVVSYLRIGDLSFGDDGVVYPKRGDEAKRGRGGVKGRGRGRGRGR
ncbi:tRNA-splicing endonuclease subunit sen54 [Saitoella coloradoensis]